MDKKIIGLGILALVLIVFFLLIFNSNSGSSKNSEIDYSGKSWLKISVWGDDGYTVRKTDKHLYIHVGIASYNPSKVGSCPYAEVEVKGCGVDYWGYTDENGNLIIPVRYSSAGELVIKCKYENYEKSLIINVE